MHFSVYVSLESGWVKETSERYFLRFSSSAVLSAERHYQLFVWALGTVFISRHRRQNHISAYLEDFLCVCVCVCSWCRLYYCVCVKYSYCTLLSFLLFTLLLCKLNSKQRIIQICNHSKFLKIMFIWRFKLKCCIKYLNFYRCIMLVQINRLFVRFG